MKKDSKRFMRQVISILLAVFLTVCCAPVEAFAWKNLTHVTSANLVLLEMLRLNRRQITIYAPYGSDKAYTYTVPEEYYEALEKYPEAFRAGSMGPDFYPDMLTGQGYIHPYDKKAKVGSGEWITLLCNSVNMMPKGSEERKRALSFTLGFMLHYCGDIFGHDFVNQFAGGTFPSVTDALVSNRDLNTMLSHMSEETYIDSKVNWDFYDKCNMLKIDAPVEFISDTMLYDGTKNNGHASIYDDYDSVPAIYKYLINLRAYLYGKAEEMRPYCDPARDAAVMYLDAWIEDLDNATVALVQCFNSMANKMVISKKPNMVNVIKDEISAWFDKYGKYITPLPDGIADLTVADAKALVEEAIKGFSFVKDTEKMESEQVESLALTHIGIPGLDEKIQEYTERMNNPEVQLDYSKNPFSPRDKAEGGNFKEFNSFVSSFANEGKELDQTSYANILNGTDSGALDKAIDSDFDAFYNTLVMFKLILIGPENFSDFISRVSNVGQTQYQKNTAELCATSLELDIRTADTPTAGTDDNIFAVVYDKEKSESVPVIKKLLDKSGKNDFESGKESSYIVELGGAVKLSNIEVEIKQESTSTAAPEWDCESITITPYHAGAALIPPIGFGGRYNMKDGDTWKLCFHDELMLRTQIADKWNTLGALSAEAVIETDTVWGAGTDDDVTLEVYNDTELIKSILLDKANYNDFEAGAKDTYIVPLAENLNETIPLEKLNLKIKCSGSTAGGTWDVKSLDITLYHGEIQLTDTISRGPKELYNSTWDLEITDDIKRKDCSRAPIALSYETNVDDGLLDFVYSLDGSHQYVNSNSLLWGNAAVRKEVFFKVFKGFDPDIEFVGERQEVSENQAFNMEFTLEGMWNGTGQSRRDKVYFNPDTIPGNVDDYPEMPTVNGNATISFIDSNGSVVCSVDQAVGSGKIQLKEYNNSSLTSGTYSVKVKYNPDSSESFYEAAEEIFTDKLTVTSGSRGGEDAEEQESGKDSEGQVSGNEAREGNETVSGNEDKKPADGDSGDAADGSNDDGGNSGGKDSNSENSSGEGGSESGNGGEDANNDGDGSEDSNNGGDSGEDSSDGGNGGKDSGEGGSSSGEDASKGGNSVSSDSSEGGSDTESGDGGDKDGGDASPEGTDQAQVKPVSEDSVPREDSNGTEDGDGAKEADSKGAEGSDGSKEADSDGAKDGDGTEGGGSKGTEGGDGSKEADSNGAKDGDGTQGSVSSNGSDGQKDSDQLSDGTVSVNQPQTVPNSISSNQILETKAGVLHFPSHLPCIGISYAKALKGTDSVIFVAGANGARSSIKKLTIRKSKSSGTATVTSITLMDGTRLSRKDLGGGLSITIDKFICDGSNTDLSRAKLKGSRVSGIFIKTGTVEGVKTASPVKIKPKYTSYQDGIIRIQNPNFEGSIAHKFAP